MVAENPIYPREMMHLSPVAAPSQTRQQQLMARAVELEAVFLSEMLAHSGLSEMQGAFGGGKGEEQFASFLRQEQARLIVQSGGLGLAEIIFNSMSEDENGTS